jgi:pyridoxal phosphate enzyme (YggS family)
VHSEPSGASPDDARAEQLRANLTQVRARIRDACAAADRPATAVRLIVVTKFWPAADVRRLAALGVRDVGESRDQEAAGKAAACADLPLRWHFVGQLQANKARSVARCADLVHSVDRLKLVAALSRGALAADRELGALVQVNLDPAERATAGPARGGVAEAEVPRLADAIAAAPGLRLGGVMTVAPRTMPAAGAFERLAQISARLRADHPSADVVSAGMSADLEAAIAAGATHVRVGTAILGVRARLG